MNDYYSMSNIELVHGGTINLNSMVHDYLNEHREEMKQKIYDNPGKGEIQKIYTLAGKFGPSITLQEIIDNFRSIYNYKCPKCNGTGFIEVEYNAYPEGLPDSGFVYEKAYKHEDCDLCNGIGYTKDKYQPRMIQDGWEKID